MTALDTALAAIDDSIQSEPDGTMRAQIRALVRGWDVRWRDSGWRAVETEEEFYQPIHNPQAKRVSKSRTFSLAGKRDALIEHPDKPNELHLYDLKSTSSNIQDPLDPFWKIQQINPQISTYYLAAWQAGRKLTGCLWDAIRKPGIKPKKITKADSKSILETGKYFGRQISTETRDIAFAGVTENAELYECRLAADIAERPDRYYQRRNVVRLDSELLEFADELWEVSQDIRECKISNRWWRSSQACFNYSRACEYLSICSGISEPDDGSWARRKANHSELETAYQDDGLTILTNSSMQTFKLCRRKYYHKHELQIEPADCEDAQPLVFGRILHKAIEAWWMVHSGLDQERNSEA